MFDHGFFAPFKGRDASILSSISRAISGERAPWRSKDRNPEREDELLRLRRESAELRAEVERLSRLPDSLRDIFTSRPHPAPDEDEVVEFEPITEAVEIERQPDIERIAYEFVRPPFARRYRGNELVNRTRVGDGMPVDLARLRKVGLPDSSDRPSATIIPFPVGRARAGKSLGEETSQEIDIGSMVLDRASPVGLYEDASASSVVRPDEQDVAAEPIQGDAISAVESVQPFLDGETPVDPPAEDGAIVEDEGVGAAPSSSETYGSATTVSADEQPTVEAPEAEHGHKDWSRSQQRCFAAWASVGQSATAIARKMERACGMSVSVKMVRVAMADRAKKLSKVKQRAKLSKARSRPL